MAGEQKIAVLIVDDHEVVRQGLVYFLETQPDIQVAGLAGSGQEALEMIPAVQPDVVLMDLVMPEMDGIEAARKIKEQSPEVRILALSTFIDEYKVTEALRVGMVGYLMKDTNSADLSRAIRSAMAGNIYLAIEAAGYLTKESHEENFEIPPSALTSRQREILIYISQGLTNQEIADLLTISIKTVKVHVSNIFDKLGLTSRTQAAIYALRNKLE